MSLSETELIYLMAYVDGQVDDDELPEVTALLARSEEARQIVAQHAALGDWVREASDARAATAGADAIAGDVIAAIDKLGGGKVIDLERERARVALNRQRVKEFSALFAVAAAAAVFWLMPTRPNETVATAPRPSAHTASPAPSARALAAAPATPGSPGAGPSGTGSSGAGAAGALASGAEAEEPNVDVQTVDSASHPFSIFYVPGATGVNAHSSSVVVWIGEEPAQ
jgi:hypothetical protein